jgi:hypothetical protein
LLAACRSLCLLIRTGISDDAVSGYTGFPHADVNT